MYVVAGNSFEVVHISDDENLDYRPVDSFLYGDLEKTINHWNHNSRHFMYQYIILTKRAMLKTTINPVFAPSLLKKFADYHVPAVYVSRETDDKG